MSLKAVSKINRKKGYVDTVYSCAECGIEIVKGREYFDETMVFGWKNIQKCSCGASLTVEVKRFYPDISEYVVKEVEDEGDD